ncbi:MAG: HAD-IA family hydrolase [Lentisphaeria bacterium]|nr:HAD-IA family hydrolase [Lentisphaeria bacterium]
MAKLLIFDLDGTLIDSRRDLAAAVNFMRQSMGLEPLDCARVVTMIGNGINSLVRRAVADADVDFETALKRMKRFYADNLLASTVLYPGVDEGLNVLKNMSLKLAVVTNKPAAATLKILEALGVGKYFSDIIGGDGEYPLKPAPDALLALQKKYNFSAGDCWMIGDHYTDLEAGRLAGFRRILVTYGFGDAKGETPDYTVDNFCEIADLIRGF